jgi:hypothetical protein
MEMARWRDLMEAEPDFCGRVAAIFDARRHKTLATLRKDGSPRVSGIETQFEDGEVVIGMMPGSVKGDDVRRDSRIAVHCTSDDPPESDPAGWQGDAKISGRAIDMPSSEQSEPSSSRFRVDIEEVVITRIGDPADHLVIESWHDDKGFRLEKRF